MQDKPAVEAKPSTTVPARAEQVGENPADRERRSRWPWIEASVWTDRMLAALENGVKGGVWYCLIDKVFSPSNLWSSWVKSARNKGAAGVDGITIDRFEKGVTSTNVPAAAALPIGNDGPTRSLPGWDSTSLKEPIDWPANP